MNRVTEKQVGMLTEIAEQANREAGLNPEEKTYGCVSFIENGNLRRMLDSLVAKGLVAAGKSKLTTRRFGSGNGSSPGGYTLYSLTDEGVRVLMARVVVPKESCSFTSRVHKGLSLMGVPDETARRLAEQAMADSTMAIMCTGRP